jgi:Tol biopolymer transport system component
VDATGPGLFLLSVESGERRRLTRTQHPREHLDPSFSPDGRALAFRCQNLETLSEICVLNLTPESEPAGEPEQVTHLGMRSTSPVWTAGGDGVFFSAGVWLSDTSLYRHRLGPGDPSSRQPEQLTAAAGEDHFSLAYSRHSRQLAYTRYRGDIDIWALRYDGRRWTPATLSPLSSSRTDMEPDFSPDGRYVAFVSDRSGSMEVWVAKPDGTQPQQLTSLGARLARTPRWSPDGRRIAFSSCGLGQSSVQVIEAEGGRPRELVKDAREECWSRDGRWLYYRSDAAFGTIRKLAVGGGGSSLEVVGGDAANPTESPDGQFLYFQRPDGIWRMPVGGGTAERVVAAESRFPYAFTVRQDGLFTLEVLKGGHYRPSLKFHSFAGNPASELVSITNGRTMLGMTASPDGKTILFCLLDQGRHNLMLVRGVQ